MYLQAVPDMKARQRVRMELRSLPSGAAGVRHTLCVMSAMVRQAKITETIWRLAQDLISDLPQKDYAGEVRRLFYFVRDRIRYRHDVRGVETLQTPEATLRLKQGDCDDKSTLLAALLESIGKRTRFVAVGFVPGQFAHVYPQVNLAGKWLGLETTEPDKPIGLEPPGIKAMMVVEN